MTWITPRDWYSGEPLTATKMNQISDQLKYLYNRPRSTLTIPGNGIDKTNSNQTTFSEVDDEQFTLVLQTSGSDVEVSLLAQTSNNGIYGEETQFDILIDDLNFASSGTPTPLTNGAFGSTRVITAEGNGGYWCFFISGLAAGVHTFRLRWRPTGGTSTLHLNGYMCQFSVREV